MTLTGIVTSDVSILIVPFSSTVTGVLSARGLLELFSFLDSFGDCLSFFDDGARSPLPPDCAELDEFNAQTKPANNKTTTKQQANRLLFIIPPRKFLPVCKMLWRKGTTRRAGIISAIKALISSSIALSF